MKNIDSLDVQIMNQLKMNARVSLAELSSATELTETALAERIDNLE